MNILHISDLHFGPRHWEGDDEVLLEKLNSYHADIVINTGDSTTDGLEDEFEAAGRFLKAIKCENVISVVGNHDKRNMRSHELFRKYIYDPEIIYPSRSEHCTKNHLFLDRTITKVKDNLTDINFIKMISIDGKSVLIICVDSSELYNDNGYIEEAILHTISNQINHISFDECLLLNHHSSLGTDEEPLRNSLRLINFINKHKIEHVFCGHTHELELRRCTDLYYGHTFTQYMCGSLSSCLHSHDDNMFLFYENWGTDAVKMHLVRIFAQGATVRFEDEIIPVN